MVTPVTRRLKKIAELRCTLDVFFTNQKISELKLRFKASKPTEDFLTPSVHALVLKRKETHSDIVIVIADEKSI